MHLAPIPYERPPLLRMFALRGLAVVLAPLQLHCVESDASVMDFVVAAIREKLTKTRRGRS